MRQLLPQRVNSRLNVAVCHRAQPAAPRTLCITRAVDPDEEEFEARIASLRKSRKAKSPTTGDAGASSTTAAAAPKPVVDYSDEELWLETKPSQVELYFNLAMAPTLVWLPLTASAVGRCAFVKYRITNKRIVTITDAPWKKEESQIGFHEVDKVLGASRFFGLYGDMVLFLKDSTKLEMRSVPDWKKVRDYIMERKVAIQGKPFDPMTDPIKKKGFA